LEVGDNDKGIMDKTKVLMSQSQDYVVRYVGDWRFEDQSGTEDIGLGLGFNVCVAPSPVKLVS